MSRPRSRQQPGAAAIENPFATGLAEPAAHVQPHVGVRGDGNPLQGQEQRAQQGKLRGHRLAGVDELRQEAVNIRIAWGLLEPSLNSQ